MFIKGMPKIINHAEEAILQSAREELKENPKSFSMRKIASKAQIAVGTIYHYFPDKVDLIAAILLEDWKKRYSTAEKEVLLFSSIEGLVEIIYHLILDFKDKNQEVFSSYRDSQGLKDYPKLHQRFISELVSLFQKGKEHLQRKKEDSIDNLVMERMLIQRRSQSIDYSTLLNAISKIIGGKNEKQL